MELFILLTIIERKRKFISPFFIEDIHATYDSLVVITVVKAFEPTFFFRVRACLEVEIFSKYFIAVIGVILVSIEFYTDVIGEELPEILGTFMGVERTKSIG